MIRKYNIALEKDAIDYILSLLARQPFEDVVELIVEIGEQMKGQVRDGDSK